MPIIVKEPEGGDFVRILAPDGLQPAVCCDVVDRGLQENKFTGQTAHKVSIHFLLAETIPSKWVHPHTNEKVAEVHEDLIGRQYGISRWFTLSLFERAALRIFLKTWRGRDFTTDELQGFDLENLIGVPAALNIVYNHSDTTNKWYANIEGVSKLPKSWDAPEIPKDYERIQDREPREEKGNGKPKNVASDPVTVEANSSGYGPDHDYTDEPVPEIDYNDSSLPF